VSNNFTDADKQEAINLFLGIFRPELSRSDPGRLPHLWDLEADHELHNMKPQPLPNMTQPLLNPSLLPYVEPPSPGSDNCDEQPASAAQLDSQASAVCSLPELRRAQRTLLADRQLLQSRCEARKSSGAALEALCDTAECTDRVGPQPLQGISSRTGWCSP